jgi:hypothetical protein
VTCLGGSTLCAGKCVETSTDPANCGTCGNACSNQNGTPLCSGGSCAGILCSAGFGNCDGMLANGCEANLATDTKNCGTCGNACVVGDMCVNGVCQATTVTCGGYAYPVDVIVNNVTCTGWFSGCTGAHEFRAVGCYATNPGNQCPSGFTPATLMEIGQWAQAANVTQFYMGTSVCMWANGSVNSNACGGNSVDAAYCWPTGTGCTPSCPTNCCPPTGPCGASGVSLPLLCVK